MGTAKILVVDDVEIVCVYLEAELEARGYTVKSAFTGEAAVAAAGKEKFDIAFIDLMLPGMDGVETCRQIKKLNPETEAILFSGHPVELEEKREAFIQAGGRDEFLRKPLMGGEALEVVEKIISEKKG